MLVHGIDVGEEPAGVPMWGEEFDDGLGIEVESGVGSFAGGNLKGTGQSGLTSFLHRQNPVLSMLAFGL